MIFPFRRRPKPGSVPALFLHIQKTAGTSLLQIARKYYGNSVVSHGDCWGKPPADFADIGFVSGHFGYAYAKHLMNGRYSFTFLRNPEERILSMYYFCRTRAPSEFEIYRLAHEMDLADFLAAGLSSHHVKTRIWNNQVWQLAHGYTHLDSTGIESYSPERLLELAQNHLMEFSHVGLTETFPEDIAVIARALEVPDPQEVPLENVTPFRPVVAEHSAAIKEMLKELTHLDRKLYDYARELRDERFRHERKWWQ